MEAEVLLEQVRGELADVEFAIRGHRFLDALEAGLAPLRSLKALAREQRLIVQSDRRSFAQLAARFPEEPAGSFFLDLAEGEGVALGLLDGLDAALGLGSERLGAYEPLPDCQAYPAFVAWLALNGSASDVALAFLANLASWDANCARVAAGLRGRYGVDESGAAFFEMFASQPADFEERAVAVIAAGLAAGDDPATARRATRLLQAYELGFWDALAGVR